MSVFRELTNGVFDLGRIGAAAKAQKEIQAKYRKRARQAAKDGSDGCTPCAAKATGVKYANSLWK